MLYMTCDLWIPIAFNEDVSFPSSYFLEMCGPLSKGGRLNVLK